MLRREWITECVGGREPVQFDFGADAAGAADVAEVGEQAVGDVHGGGGEAGQGTAEGDTGRGAIQTGAQCGGGAPLQQRQGGSGIPQGAADPEVFTGARTSAPQRATRFDKAVRGHADRQRTAGGVAADEGDAVLHGQRQEAVEEAIQPGGVRRRQGQRKRAPRWLGAHRGQVGQVHRQCLPADVGGRGADGKMHALVEGVGADHQLPAGGDLDQRGIVADAQHHVGPRGRALADALDQVELRHGGQRRRAASTSGWRHCAAARSSTPLT